MIDTAAVTIAIRRDDFQRILQSIPCLLWSGSVGPNEREHWRAVARKARERPNAAGSNCGECNRLNLLRRERAARNRQAYLPRMGTSTGRAGGVALSRATSLVLAEAAGHPCPREGGRGGAGPW